MTRVSLISQAGLKSLQWTVHIQHIACIHFWRCCGSCQRSYNGPTTRTCPIRWATVTVVQPLSASSNWLGKTPLPGSRQPLSGQYETSFRSTSPLTPRSMNMARARSVICVPVWSQSEVIQRVNRRDTLRCQKRLQQQCLELQPTGNCSHHKSSFMHETNEQHFKQFL